ncbi:MAG: amidohydrolase family protein [Reichenbachiella sp.]
MKIDSHQHFWNYDAKKHAWIDDSMSLLKRDFLASDLKVCLDQTSLDGCVAVQADQSENETDFLIELAEENDFIKAVVGWIDLRSKNVENRLKHFAGFEKVKGFRHVVQDEPDPNFMLGEEFQKGISLLTKYNFSYDILIFPSQFEAALETVKRHPKQKFVIDHIAKPNIKNGELGEWMNYMAKVGKQENVMCKLSGMVTEADWTEWKDEDFTPYLDIVISTFGIDRVMFGSDWPVCLLGGEYGAVKGIVDQYFEEYSEIDKSKVFGLNAAEFYGIK